MTCVCVFQLNLKIIKKKVMIQSLEALGKDKSNCFNLGQIF